MKILFRPYALAALIVFAIAVSSLLAQDREYFVNGQTVPERVYRAATLTNDALGLIKADRLGDAKEKLLEALRLAPEFSAARYNLGVVLTKLGEKDAAAAQFTAVVSAGSEVPEAWVSLAALHYDRQKYDDALALLDDAARRFPVATWDKIPEYYFNRGLALAKVGRTAEAIEAFKLVLSADPERALTWLNLGTLYQESGELEDSIAHYREFLRRAPQGPDAPVVADSIKNIESELRLAKSRPPAEPNAEDYYFSATQGRAKSWPSRSMPLRVYIHGGEGAAGFQARYIDILKTAFDEWSRASEGRVRFHITDRIRDADIECLWTSDPSQLRNRSEGGETRVYFRENSGIYDAQIFILTVPITRSSAVTDSSIHFIALHEIGHALGMMGHSTDPHDVMYFSMSVADKEHRLSARDKKTLLRLYGRK
ncbi:MAG TPA: tetratricopeptide repeat protein [Verrucomicrobiae bacterium]|jgi:tetratricopeptide (TPR) repeat protein|nr:tetratricopeptide repeat protein [Verrucomicrobiae bacterium]